MQRAVEIPAILPVPTVAASAVQTAWNGVIAPSEASLLRNILPSVVRIAYGNFRIWRKRVRRLR